MKTHYNNNNNRIKVCFYTERWGLGQSKKGRGRGEEDQPLTVSCSLNLV